MISSFSFLKCIRMLCTHINNWFPENRKYSGSKKRQMRITQIKIYGFQCQKVLLHLQRL